MSTDPHLALLERAVAAFNAGDLDGLAACLTEDFFGYQPQPGEQTQPQAFRAIAADLRRGFPDAQLTLADVVSEGGEVRAAMTLRGTYLNAMWGCPGDGKEHSLTGAAVARFAEGRMAVRWEEDLPLVPFLREIGIAHMPEKAHLKPECPVSLPEIVLRLAFNNMRLQEKECSHLDQIQVREPAADLCLDCVALGAEWPALRMCLTCGYVGCCDMSVHKHMQKHCAAAGHPLIRSIEPGEAWLWCYPDAAFLSSRHLAA